MNVISLKIKINNDWDYLDLSTEPSFKKNNGLYLFSDAEFSRSTTIKLPTTEHNLQVLNNPNLPVLVGNYARLKLDARLTIESGEIEGKLLVNKYSEHNLDCTFIFDSCDILDYINEKNINEVGLLDEDWSILWVPSNCKLANDYSLVYDNIAIIPYLNDATLNHGLASQFYKIGCFYPSLHVSKLIQDILTKSKTAISSSVNINNLFDDIPIGFLNDTWMITDKLTKRTNNTVEFAKNEYINITSGTGTYEGDITITDIESTMSTGADWDLWNGWHWDYISTDLWHFNKGFSITFGNIPPHTLVFAIKGNIGGSYYWNLKTKKQIKTEEDLITIEPGETIEVNYDLFDPTYFRVSTLGFAFYDTIHWETDDSSYDKGHFYASQEYNNGTYQIQGTIASIPENTEEEYTLIPFDTWKFSENAPEMTVMDLIKSFAYLTGTQFLYDTDTNSLRFVRSKTLNTYEIDKLTKLESLERKVGDFNKTEAIVFDSKDYIEKAGSTKLSLQYSINNDCLDNSRNEHVIKGDEGANLVKSNWTWRGPNGIAYVYGSPIDWLYRPDSKLDIEKNDEGVITSVSVEYDAQGITFAKTNTIFSHFNQYNCLQRLDKRSTSAIPEDYFYKDIFNNSTKYNVNFPMSIQDYFNVRWSTDFLLDGIRYAWLSLNWDKGIAKATLQKYTDYLSEYVMINTTSDPLLGGNTSGDGYYAVGDTCTLSATVNPGCTFLYWTVQGFPDILSTDLTFSFTVLDTDDNKTFVAHYLVPQYNITLNVYPQSYMGSVSGGGLYYSGEACTAIATAAPGYLFDGWYENNVIVSNDPNYIFVVDRDRILDAHFIKNPSYRVSLTSNPVSSSIILQGAGFYNPNDSCTVSTNEPGNLRFYGWYENNNLISTNNPYTFIVNRNINLIARFLTKYKVKVNVIPTNSGTIEGEGLYNTGDSCILIARPNSGYIFSHWENTDTGDIFYDNKIEITNIQDDYNFDAHFEYKPGKVNINIINTTGGSTSGAGSYNIGDTVNLIATPNSGYEFYCWGNEGEKYFDNPYTFTATEDKVFIAEFKKSFISISAISNPIQASRITGTGDTYYIGDTCILRAVPIKRSYTFINWTENDIEVSTDNPYTFTVQNNRSLVANFSSSTTTYTISAITNPINAGTITGTGTYTEGNTCTLTVIPNTGYRFINWTEDGTEVSTETSYTFTVQNNRNLVANFRKGKYTINVYVNPDDSGNVIFNEPSYTISSSVNPLNAGTVIGDGEYNEGDICTLEATPTEGYVFVNYTEDDTIISTSSIYSFTVDSSRNIIANFEKETFTMITSVNPTNSGSANGSGTYEYGDECILTAIPNEGYTFNNWTEDDTEVSTDNPYSFTVVRDRELVANFDINSYIITTSVNPTDSGSVSGGGSYDFGDDCTLTATPSTGYSFINWTVDGVEVSRANPYTFTVQNNRSIQANFGINTYTITTNVNPLGAGSINGGGSYNYGESCTLRIIQTTEQAQQYSFVNWTIGGVEVSTESTYTFTVDSNVSIQANFEVNTYTITTSVNPLNAGTVSGNGNFNYGDTCILTATPNTGYDFINWTEDGTIVSTDSNYSFTVNDNRSLSANFNKISYTVSASVSPSGSGTITGTGTYNYGDTCTLTFNSSTGYNFTSWKENGTVVSTNNPYTFTVESDRTFVAESQDITNYFTIQSSLDNTEQNNIYLVKTNNPHEISLAYNIGDYNSQTGNITWRSGWTYVNINEEYETRHDPIRLTPGSKVRFRGDNTGFSKGPDNTGDFYHFEATQDIILEGSLTTLISKHDSINDLTTLDNPRYLFFDLFLSCPVVNINNLILKPSVLSPYCYIGLFWDCNKLTSIPANLFINITTLSEGCFNTMFGETGITSIPSTLLPFTTLAPRCYDQMFRSTGITTIPYNLLPATTLAERCYNGMFNDTNITSIDSRLLHTQNITLAQYCYRYMFGYCSRLTTIPYDLLQSTSLETGCYDMMFQGCNALVSVPSNLLPATTLADYCYWGMFSFCSNLEDGPYLPATTLANHCYEQLFYYSPKLNNIHASFTSWISNEATKNWVYNVSNNGVFYGTENLPDQRGVDYIPVNWTKSPLTITATSLHSTITGTGTYNYGDSCTLTCIPESADYEFYRWLLDDYEVSRDNPYTFTVRMNRHFIASLKNYHNVAVDINPTDSGTTTGQGRYEHLSNCTLEARPNVGYRFINWSNVGGVEVSTDNPYTFQVMSNSRIVANFTKQNYNITAVPNYRSACTITGDGTYDNLDSCTLGFIQTAEQAGLYTFLNWTENDVIVSTNPSYTFQVEGNRDLVANFRLNVCTITTSVNPTGSGTVSGGGEYNIGDTCTLTPTPSTGYIFVNWTEDGTEISRNPSYSFTVSEDREITANFEIATYTITLTKNGPSGSTSYIHLYGAGTYAYGDTCTIQCSLAGQYYYFNQWSTTSGGLVSKDNPYSFTVNSNRTIRCDVGSKYLIEPGVIGSGGTVSGAQYITPGDTCTVQAYPNSGYEFDYWTDEDDEDIISRDNPYTFTPRRNMESDYLSAKFKVESKELTFTALQNNSTVKVVKGSSAPDVNLQYSMDDGSSWSTYTVGNTITLSTVGSSVKFKGLNDKMANSKYTSNANQFILTGSIKASGYLISLLQNGTSINALQSFNTYAFAYLFYGQTALTDISELIMPTTTISYCYYGMFSGCTGLTSIPSTLLPATTLISSSYCYGFMFDGCTGITSIPSGFLPATTLATGCYTSMFGHCSGLISIPTDLLPATTLSSGCYSNMFQYCSSLTVAPYLPATELVNYCYEQMFYNCSSLSSIHVKLTSWNENDSKCSYWVRNVSSTGTFYCPSSLTRYFGNSNIPTGWTVQNWDD